MGDGVRIFNIQQYVEKQIVGIQNFGGKDENFDVPEAYNETAEAIDLFPYFTIGFRERQRDLFENMLSVIRDPRWDENKDHARHALAIYTNQHALVPRLKPKTFSKWYQLFCRYFGFEYTDNYNPAKLTPNDATRAIELYLP